jgi:hypothetical protein
MMTEQVKTGSMIPVMYCESWYYTVAKFMETDQYKQIKIWAQSDHGRRASAKTTIAELDVAFSKFDFGWHMNNRLKYHVSAIVVEDLNNSLRK